MNRRFRLTRSEDFNQLKRDGETVSNRLFKIVMRPNGTSTSRFGIITGKSIGNAVTRNRCKRLMRASIQSMYNSLQQGWDVIVIVRQAAVQADYQATRSGLIDLLLRAGMLKEKTVDA